MFGAIWANIYIQAEGTQSFFDCNAYANPTNGVHNDIDTRIKLESYDPDLYQLIKEVFPCENTYLQRCSSSRGKYM